MAAASADTYSKAWYGRQLERLHQEAHASKQRVPEDALRHLPLESLAEVIHTTFKDYDTRATTFAERCLFEGNIDTFLSFIKAHHDILERFEMPATKHYRDMARIIGNHLIRKTREEVGWEPEVVTVHAPPMPDYPTSGPPTPCTVLSWIKDVDDSYSEPLAQQAQWDTIMPVPIMTAPANDISAAPDNQMREATDVIENRQSSQRQRHPREEKKPTANQESKMPPKTTSKRARKGSAADVNPERKEPTPATTPEKKISQPAQGAKRRRVEDALVAIEDSQATKKRRKNVKLMTRVKR